MMLQDMMRKKTGQLSGRRMRNGRRVTLKPCQMIAPLQASRQALSKLHDKVRIASELGECFARNDQNFAFEPRLSTHSVRRFRDKGNLAQKLTAATVGNIAAAPIRLRHSQFKVAVKDDMKLMIGFTRLVKPVACLQTPTRTGLKQGRRFREGFPRKRFGLTRGRMGSRRRVRNVPRSQTQRRSQTCRLVKRRQAFPQYLKIFLRDQTNLQDDVGMQRAESLIKGWMMRVTQGDEQVTGVIANRQNLILINESIGQELR